MPEKPVAYKRSPTFPNPSPRDKTQKTFRYAELHCRTNYSFLEGASHPDELVVRASELALGGLAITDRNSLAGVVRAHTAAKEVGLPLLIGAEIVPTDANPVVLLATDRASYGKLSRLITLGRRRTEKGECLLSFNDVAEHSTGLLACVVLHPRGWNIAPPKSRTPLRCHDPDGGCLSRYKEVCGDRAYGLAELRRGDDDAAAIARMAHAARNARVPLVAAGDVFYHDRARRDLQDVLTCIREGSTLAEAKDLLFPNAERHLRSADEMLELFADHPEAVARTLEVADRCHFSLDQLRYEYPEELCPAGERPIEYLRTLAWQGAHRRYPDGIPDKVRRLIERELALIEELHYEAYFLTVWDLVRYARSRDILCQGRGSAANSAVCYCLEVTSVDPDRIHVLFERFISKERNEAPDIDIDFEHQRREEVIQYVYEKYGRDRSGMTAEVITYQLRSAVRDVGKVMGFSTDRIDALAKGLEGFRGHEHSELAARITEAGLEPESPRVRQFVRLVSDIVTFPRHLSQHVGGMVMTKGPLAELVPIENAAMEGRTVIQWDKDDLDALGVLKVDCLALGMLSAIHRCFDFIEKHNGVRYTLATVPAEDPKVYEMIRRADTIGVFQIESRAQMSMLPRLRPACYYDLVIEVAIVRPGPIQGDMVHPYLRRRMKREEPDYPIPAFKNVLSRTLGVPLFQEQVMQLVVEAAGFTPGEADQLRRAMAAWKRKGGLDKFRQKLIDGFKANGLSEEMGERIFNQIRGFGEYGFPESHAASFALLVYVSAWLKRHHPAAFTAAILNSLPMGFYAPAQLVRDAQEHGVQVRPADVNASDWDCTLEEAQDSASGKALRLGLRLVQGMRERDARTIMAARAEGGPFRSMDDLARRAGLRSTSLARLSAADACRSLQRNRRQALWNSLVPRDDMPLFDRPDEDDVADLPDLTSFEKVIADYRTVGLTLRQHPISFLRPQLDSLGVARSKDLATIRNGSFVKVAGLVLLRQQPSTAKGIRFMTLEDETGVANLVVRPHVWDRHRRMAARASTLLVHGTLERHGIVIHVLVKQMLDLTKSITDFRGKSRNFR